MKLYQDYLDSKSTIQSIINNHALNTPEKLAIIDENKVLTYKELDQVSDQIAQNILNSFVVDHDSIIGVYFSKSYMYILAALSSLKTGAKLLHLDEDYNKETLNFIIQETKPVTILIDQKLLGNLPKNINHLILDDNFINSKNVSINLNLNYDHNNTAIIGYTSGTTGKPKGVEVSHRACIYSFNKFWEQIDNVKHKDNFGYITYLAWDAFSPLVNGSTGIFIPNNASHDMEILSNKLINLNIENAFFTPSLLDKFLNSLSVDQLEKSLEKVNVIWIGGEIVKKSTIFNLKKVKATIKIFNNYGPTECFVVSQGLLEYDQIKDDLIVNAGYVLPELTYKLLNDNDEDVTLNELGFLYIRGPALANKYFSNKELTDKQFVSIDNEIYFATGDYCQVDKNRKITILGRNNFILKDKKGIFTPASAIENLILDSTTIDDCVIITKNETSAIVFILSEQDFSLDIIQGLIQKFTDNFTVLRIKEIPIKSSSQKINYEKLLESVRF